MKKTFLLLSVALLSMASCSVKNEKIENLPAMALKVHGAYPHSRYFSFTLYNDADGSAINGSSDYQLLPDEGSVNPFVETSDKDNYFTVYIVPAKVATEEALAQLDAKNLIVVNEEAQNCQSRSRRIWSSWQEGEQCRVS